MTMDGVLSFEDGLIFDEVMWDLENNISSLDKVLGEIADAQDAARVVKQNAKKMAKRVMEDWLVVSPKNIEIGGAGSAFDVVRKKQKCVEVVDLTGDDSN